jgi:iron(III) transport system substrate-binding protein
MSTGALRDRLLAEADAPGNDIILGSAATTMVELRVLRLLKPDAVDLAGRLPHDLCDPAGTWFAPTGFITAFAVCGERLAQHGARAPSTWRDLLQPELRGEIAMPDPRVSGAGYLIVTALLENLGTDLGWRFLADLRRQVPELMPSAWLPVDAASRGLSSVALSVAIAVIAANRSRNGDGARHKPLSLVIPRDGARYEPEVFAMMRGTRQQAAARRVLEWMLSASALPLYQRYGKVICIKGAESGGADMAGAALVPIDVRRAAGRRGELVARVSRALAQ